MFYFFQFADILTTSMYLVLAEFFRNGLTPASFTVVHLLTFCKEQGGLNKPPSPKLRVFNRMEPFLISLKNLPN